jgi:hypothetical protein
MNPATELQIRNVRKFGRYARPFCALFAVTFALLALWALWNIATGPTGSGFKVGLGAYDVTGDHMTTVQVKAWSAIVVTAVFGILLVGLVQLYRLFGNLALGAIYTKENVHHIRQVGLLALAMAVLQIILPMISYVLLQTGFIDPALVTSSGEEGGRLEFGPHSLGGFISAALVLLVSWIMDVGRQTADDAEAMRREADLVI